MPARRRQTVDYPPSNPLLQLRSAVDDLAALETVFNAVAESTSVEALKDIRDKAEAVRQYAHNAKASLILQNRAAELKLRAERRAGALLQSMSLHGGDRKSDKHHARPTLDELGLSQNQSKRWQKEASVPEADFCAFVAMAQRGGYELTTASLLRLAATRFADRATCGEADLSDVNVLPLHAGPRLNHDCSQPQDIIAELLNHCGMLDGILSPLYCGGDPRQLHPCLGRALQRLVREIRTLLAELEHRTTATAIGR